jgi:superfamily II DNA or RNA helicase
MDQLSRNEDIQEKLKAAPEWDLVVVDEAHRMSGHVFGTEIKLTEPTQHFVGGWEVAV